MIAAWMLVSALLGGAIAVGAVALDGVCRALRVPTRWTWVGALTLIILLTILVPLRRARDANGASTPLSLVTTTSTGPQVTGSTSALAQALSSARAAIDAPFTRLTSTVVRATPPVVDRTLLVLWTACSALLLGMGVVVFRRLLQAHRTWPVEMLHGERVHVAPHAGPAVLGFARGTIVVPRWLAECTADVQEVVVAHEREHLRARDPILLTVGALAVVLLPWNPAAWWVLARLRLAVELDCDRRVLDGGVRARSYGALLIDLAGRTAGVSLGAPLVGLTMLAERTTHLERRIVAMSAPRSRHVAARIAAGSLVALAAVLVACEARMPTSVDVDNMTAASAERAATAAGFVNASDSQRTYYIDGYLAGAAAARALPANQIASIAVRRDSANRSRGTVWITTVAADSASAAAHGGAPAASGTKGKTFHAVTLDPSRFAGRVFIDGRRADPNALRTLDPGDIVGIHVIKGPHAAELYPDDPAAAQGVIQVTTKHAH